MKLYIGGYAQGKLNYVVKQLGEKPYRILEGKPETGDKKAEVLIFHGLHLWVKAMIEAGEPAEDKVADFLKENPESILISDEVGNGIVPMRKEEREYRERLGRILISCAEQAERVERIVCGLGQRLK